jgi:tetratricopeptide (TPR) repeat protein
MIQRTARIAWLTLWRRAGIGLCCLTLLAGCSSTSSTDVPGSPPAASHGRAEDPLRDPLDKPLRREARRPVEQARTAPAPDGINADALAPLRLEDRAVAELPLDAALAEVAQHFPEPRAPLGAEISEEVRAAALAAYARGRAALLAERYDDAIAHLEEAARIDPDAPEPWRELARAQLARGDRIGASVSFSRAFDRDPTDAAVLEQVALLAAERNEGKRAAAILARLRELPSTSMDPAMQYVVPAKLGEALLALGYADAAIELLREGVDLPESFNEPSGRAAELAALYRQRGDILRQVGDAHMTLERYDAALLAYAEAKRYPSMGVVDLTERSMLAAMRLGRPTLAAALVIEELIASPGGITARQTALLAYSVEHGADRSAVGRSLDALASSLDRSRVGDFVRTRAAILPADERLDALRSYTQSNLLDDPLLVHFLQEAAQGGDVAMMREASSLVERDALFEPVVASAARQVLPDPQERVAALDAVGSAGVGPALLRARALEEQGDLQQAEQIVAGLAIDNDPAVIARWVELLSRSGRVGTARSLISGIDVESSLRHCISAARAVRALSGPEASLAVIELPAASDSETLLALAHQLTSATALEAGRIDQASESADRAVGLAPRWEMAQSLRLRLDAPTSPIGDETRFRETLGTLREVLPQGRILRLLRAQQFGARGQTDIAERRLLELAEAYPADPDIVGALIRLWMGADALDRANTWLDEQRSLYPGLSVFVIWAAEVGVRQSDPQIAVELLSTWLARYPGDDDISVSLERVYRTHLDDEEMADRIAINRLSRRPATPELAQRRTLLFVRTGQMSRALEQAEIALRDETADRDQLRVWGNALARELLQAVLSSDVGTQDAVPLFRALYQGVELSEDSSLGYLVILAKSQTHYLDTIPELERFLELHPVHAERALVTVGTNLWLRNVLPTTGERTRLQARTLALPADRDMVISRWQQASAVMLQAIEMIDDQQRQPRLLATALVIARDLAIIDETDESTDAFVDLGEAILDFALPTDVAVALASFYSTNFRGVSLSGADAASDLANSFNRVGAAHLADGFDELALAVDPDHINANNNLGYRLLVRGERIDEAVRMIETAYALEPDAAHIVDSMGWARYAQGIIYDEVDENGVVVRPGAISLLRRALRLVSLERGGTQLVGGPVMHDHLGDALWRAGQREDAIAAWDQAIADAESALQSDEAEGFGVQTLEELQSVQSAARSKADAARQDLEPELAPMYAPVNQPPAAASEPTP